MEAPAPGSPPPDLGAVFVFELESPFVGASVELALPPEPVELALPEPVSLALALLVSPELLPVPLPLPLPLPPHSAWSSAE